MARMRRSKLGTGVGHPRGGVRQAVPGMRLQFLLAGSRAGQPQCSRIFISYRCSKASRRLPGEGERLEGRKDHRLKPRERRRRARPHKT